MFSDYLKHLIYKYSLVRNIFRRQHGQRAFVSYIVHPFLPFKRRYHHSNILQIGAIVEVLDEAGFVVDIADYRVSSRIIPDNYDLYFGFGDALEYVAQNLSPNQKLIAYATGRSAPYQAAESIRRGVDYQSKYGTFPTQSLRIPSALWTSQIMLAHGLMIIGDEATAQTFDCYPQQPRQVRRAISVPHWAKTDGSSFVKSRNWDSAKLNLLWFGGAGVVHKGLDLCISAICHLPNVTLHVCGVSDQEKETVDRCLSFHASVEGRIKQHGFVHAHTEKFVDIVKGCAFVLLPSCSEGQATSILTAVAGGGLIPIINDRCGCNNIPTPFRIEGMSVSELVGAISNAVERDQYQLIEIASACVKYVLEEHSINKYKEKVRNLVSEVIEKPKEVVLK